MPIFLSRRQQEVAVVSCIACGAFAAGALTRGLLDARRRRRAMRTGDGVSGPTNDLSLFYDKQVQDLTKITAEMERLPGNLYSQVVALMPVLCIDLAIERADGRLLLVHRATEPVKGYFWWPGGRILRNETFYKAAERKAWQEIGLKPEPIGILGVWNTFFPTSEWGGTTQTVNICVHMRLSQSADVQLDSTSDGHCWVSRKAALQERDPYVRAVTEAICKQQYL